jgi:hypothetical protein
MRAPKARCAGGPIAPPAVSLVSTSMLKDMLVIDADSHWSEPPGLLTRRAPAEQKDRVPRVAEIDFPHPTCLYPKPLPTAEAKMETLPLAARRKILGENARELYRL